MITYSATKQSWIDPILILIVFLNHLQVIQVSLVFLTVTWISVAVLCSVQRGLDMALELTTSTSILGSSWHFLLKSSETLQLAGCKKMAGKTRMYQKMTFLTGLKIYQKCHPANSIVEVLVLSRLAKMLFASFCLCAVLRNRSWMKQETYELCNTWMAMLQTKIWKWSFLFFILHINKRFYIISRNMYKVYWSPDQNPPMT